MVLVWTRFVESEWRIRSRDSGLCIALNVRQLAAATTRNTNVRSNQNGYRTPSAKSKRRSERRTQRAQARCDFPRQRGTTGWSHRIVRPVPGHAQLCGGYPGGLQAFDFHHPGGHRQGVLRRCAAHGCRRFARRRFETSRGNFAQAPAPDQRRRRVSAEVARCTGRAAMRGGLLRLLQRAGYNCDAKRLGARRTLL
jgi:hypothetical protein